MKVFKACLIVIKRHLTSLLIYFVIFITLSVVMTAFSVKKYSTDFSETKPNFTLINRDENTPLSEGLLNYLQTQGTQVVLEDRKEALQDATFYHASDYIAIIPQGFHESFTEGEALSIQTVTTPDSARGYYVDSLVNQYLNLARSYRTADPGMDEEVLISEVLDDLSLETGVEKMQFGEGQPVDESYEIYNRMLCYIMIVLIILCVSTILMVFRRPDLNMRNLCSPIKPRSMNGQLVLCGSLVSLAAWIFLTAVGFILYGSRLLETDGRIIALVMLNGLVFTVLALALAMLAGSFVQNPNTQNAVSNFLSLGLCFLGGVFVPLEMFGESMLTVARLMPTYWYMTALEQICDLTSFDSGAMAPVWQGMLIQLGFTAALMCVALAISKYKRQSEKSFGSVRSEIEA